MTAFHTEYNVIGIHAQAQDQGPPQVTVNATVGMVLPIQTQSGELPIVPIGQIQFQLSREDAIAIGKEGEKLEDRPKRSLAVANNMADVERAAQVLNRVTG